MDPNIIIFILLPIGLGLLGFVEPCTIGGHLLFLDTQKGRTKPERMNAVTVFIITRALIMGLFGALIAFLGQRLIGVQTGVWLIFGSIYLIIGLAFIFGRTGVFKQRISLAPAAWKRAKNPMVLGLAFGLNIPACAAPILFGLLGLAATSGTMFAGFSMMALFGLALSFPLIIVAANQKFATLLEKLGQHLKQKKWVIGFIFILLGFWSIYFGLFVDPANWVGNFWQTS